MKKLRWVLTIVLAVISLVLGCKGAPTATTDTALTSQGAGQVAAAAPAGQLPQMKITTFNVGKADAHLIQVAGKNIVIDAGLPEDGNTLVKRLRALNVGQIDTLIMTHPHKDHLGGMVAVLNSISVKNFYDPEIKYNSKLYVKMLNLLATKHIATNLLQGPSVLQIAPYATLEILWPLDKSQRIVSQDPNVNSLVMRLVYGKYREMFTADSYKESEYAIIAKYPKDKLQAQVLKVAHHTSNTSTSWEWLDAVNPEVAVASYGNIAGVDKNKYPNKKTLKRIKDHNIKFYGTYEQGDIIITTDGVKYKVATAK